VETLAYPISIPIPPGDLGPESDKLYLLINQYSMWHIDSAIGFIIDCMVLRKEEMGGVR
jgi:hypothetical protein